MNMTKMERSLWYWDDSYEYDENGDGVADYSYEYMVEYDENYQVISQMYTEDLDGDGVTDYGFEYVIEEYDANGGILSATETTTEDGMSETYTVEYDEEGNESVIVYDVDYDSDGVADESTTYYANYDEYGSLESYDVDYDSDGSIDESFTYETVEYDENGNVVYEAYDYDLDGVADIEYTYEYDDQGNMISDSYYSSYWEEMYTTTYEFDENGDLITESYEEDWDGDGELEAFYSYSYEYDENGNMISESYLEDYIL